MLQESNGLLGGHGALGFRVRLASGWMSVGSAVRFLSLVDTTWSQKDIACTS